MERGSFALQASAGSDSVEFVNISLSEFVAYQAFDYQRFALSSRESLGLSASELIRGGIQSWPLITAYYAAFFGGHAVLIAIGQGIVRVESSQAKRLTELGKLYAGTSFVFSTGTYTINLRQNNDRSYDLVASKAPDTGGAHDVFWRVFYRAMTDLSHDIALASEPDSTLACARIAEITSLCSARGLNAGTWLSLVRNEINYQHKYGVWFPTSVSRENNRFVKGFRYTDTSQIRLDFDANKTTIEPFQSATTFIASLSHELAENLINFSGKKSRHFSQKWQRLCSLYKFPMNSGTL